MKAKKNILIADSGGTKTDWALINDTNNVQFFKTQGINPIHQNQGDIELILKNELSNECKNADEVYFYGAGCKGNCATEIREVLQRNTSNKTEIHIETDLMGAARALFKNECGIACILGTGSNSCVYDGNKILANTSALGYILGDEGSGAVLGKMFLNGIYKGLLPERLKISFEKTYNENLNSIISKVYKQPLANRFLASLCLFIKDNTQDEMLNEMIIDNFSMFFRKNLVQYKAGNMQVGVVGGMGFYFESQLKLAAQRNNINLISIIKSPIHGLIEYHKDKMK